MMRKYIFKDNFLLIRSSCNELNLFGSVVVNDKNIRFLIDVYYEVRTINGSIRHQTSDQQCANINNELELNQTERA